MACRGSAVRIRLAPFMTILSVLFSKLLREIRSPTKKFLKIIIYNFHFTLYKINIFKYLKIRKKPVLIFDLRSNSITFDIIYTIFDAYLYFQKKGYKYFDLIIYKHDNYEVKTYKFDDYSDFVDDSDIKKRIHSMLIPIARKFNCINNIYEINAEKSLALHLDDKFDIMPEFYNSKYYFPVILNYRRVFNYFKSEMKYGLPNLNSELTKLEILEIINESKTNKNFITFTLRDYGFSPSRNSTNYEIKILYEYAKLINVNLILIPDDKDNISKYEIPEDVIIFNLARDDIYYRIGIYSYSVANFFMPSGPADLSHFISSSKTIIFNWGLDIPAINEYGLKYFEQPYLNFGGYLIWHQKHRKYDVTDIKNAINVLSN